MFTTHAETDVVARSKKLRATNASAEAVLDVLHVGHASKATGRMELPALRSAPGASSSTGQPPLALQDATVEQKIKLRLDDAHKGAEGLLFKANKVAAALIAAPKRTAFQETVLAKVQSGVQEVSAVRAELAAAVLKWVTAKMTMDDSELAVEQLNRAKEALDGLAEWTKTGGAVKLSIAPLA